MEDPEKLIAVVVGEIRRLHSEPLGYERNRDIATITEGVRP